ncbi:MAG: hypothetical protein FWE09_01845 [Treponema sp.]|nr:hypothetical protein [Treponema sp.]
MESSTDNLKETPALPGAAAHIVPAFLRHGSRYALALTLVFFGLFAAGGMADPGAPDPLLLMFLALLRYSAFALFALSVVALGFAARALGRAPLSKCLRRIFLYFFFALLAALAVMFSLLVAAVSRGVAP